MDEERDDVGARAAIGGRRSVRRFLDLPVADDTLRRILELSARAASGGNL
ncbi:MAG TPA: nitroreductase family protein, partial [Hyphomicrobiales bacterium]|nr:nitroreductase family protein [Hyphomicrobiales bacterium]